tara:strand:- start:669 stop:1343 length:675 start_codon:yes stop_codon:yes gene_type:complete
MNLEINMKIFYINLKKRTDRKEHMEKMLSNLNLDYDRFEAICPTIDEIKFGIYKKFYDKACLEFKKYVNNKVTHPRATGVFGCYLSHLNIHESQLENSNPYIILEDDVEFTTDTLVQLEQIISKYKDWDIVRGGVGRRRDGLKQFNGVHHDSIFSKSYRTHARHGGSHFCIFRKAKKIVDYMYSENVFAIDKLYSTCVLNVYYHRIGVTVGGFGTDIPKIENKL